MIELNKVTLLEIDGGLSISGSLLTAFSKVINSLLDVGRSLGSAVRRINGGQICPLR